ncbi:MAG TPA: NADH-quinone oxidoreductase subunit NuoH [Gemmataceae bacterium]|jgi:NADH-quinone oxidoreductase subunit H|nr:NADH-quinone oxidoreductase subunit NuoH [Gemmataceae bacterium]
MPEFNLLYTVITIVVVMGALQGTCAYLIMVERKVCAWMQDRIGPNRVGPYGLLQPIADGLKFLLKEDIIPDHVDKFLFLLAPAVSVSTALLAFAVVPFGATYVAGNGNPAAYEFVIAPSIDIGIVFIFAVSSLNVYGIVLGGWASNNKYSFLGAIRSSAQLISYEIPMGMSILGIVLVTGSLNLEHIIGRQAANGFFGWNLWYQPLAFVLFLTSVLAECNRVPFDLAEAEQELVGGYHTEYSALKFGLFFLAEYTHVITTSFLLTILFLGGWQFPWIAEASEAGILAAIVKLVVFAAKMFGFIILYMLIRWTIPRFRFDQLMGLAWRVMMPLSLLNFVAVACVKQFGWSEWFLLPISLVLLVGFTFLAGFWPEQPKRVVIGASGQPIAEVSVR